MKNATVTTPMSREQAFALVDAVSEHEELALSATAFENENGEWMFEATCETKPDLESFSQIATLALGGNVTFSVEKIDPEIDWIAKSLEGLPPVSAGGFFIHAGHNRDEIPPGVIPIHIEAAQAFGTGHHETTAGCLQAIHMVLQKKHPGAVLDVGTGTGVLAIALAKRLRQKVIASDIDPVAVNTTRENARLNTVTDYITAIEATGLDSKEIRTNGPYDLVVANILARPLADLAPNIASSTSKGATIILSGILNEQAPQVISAYGAQSVVLVQRILLKQWSTLILEKI